MPPLLLAAGLRVERVEHNTNEEPERDRHDDRGEHKEREPHGLDRRAWEDSENPLDLITALVK